MKSRECVVWNHRKHVVFHVIVHVPVEKTKDGVHVNSARVMAMIKDIFSQASMLGQTKDDVEPGSVHAGQADQHQWKPTLVDHTSRSSQSIDHDPDTGHIVNFVSFHLWDVVSLLGSQLSKGM